MVTYPVKFKKEYPDGACVVKLWFGKKFMIWKFKELVKGSQMLSKQISDKIVKLKINTLEQTDLFYNSILHISEHKIKICTIEVLFRSEKPEELLLKETHFLNKNKGLDTSLNANITPYMPAWMSGSEQMRPKVFDAFNFTLKGNHKSVSAIVKIWIGSKYMIWKFKAIGQGMEKLNQMFNSKLRNGVQEYDLFKKAVHYVLKEDITHGVVEVLMKSNDICELYEFEKSLLKGKDSNRLNINKVPYIPAWMNAIKKHTPKTF